MSTFSRAAGIAILSTIGFVGAAYAGETSAAMEKMKGESKALVEEGKGQTKGAVEDVKGNKTSAEVERAKGSAKAGAATDRENRPADKTDGALA